MLSKYCTSAVLMMKVINLDVDKSSCLGGKCVQHSWYSFALHTSNTLISFKLISSQLCHYQPIPPACVPEKPKVGSAYAEGEARKGAETNEGGRAPESVPDPGVKRREWLKKGKVFAANVQDWPKKGNMIMGKEGIGGTVQGQTRGEIDGSVISIGLVSVSWKPHM